ncbi:OsmC family protein [Natronococcus occultus]|uniref:Putative redox protein, regulator of disulfide bond formation n=1 Tax=Natronococcus occultus SP4 TaxID=694430 RepID=L0JTZ5_9EURY|nr:OsmC family protein [Natronococcus occultus]AGB36226.1 putative redox protein, regulator of disulfide bond formation [Natronococcus occultus SP4]
MSESNLQEEQEPLKAEYEENPEAARVTLTATGEEGDDSRACSVDIGRAIHEAELHEGAGGPGTGACSGDLLLGALAACSQLTAQAVAENFGLDVDVGVEASGDLDLRGTMGVAEDVPVGFQDIRLEVTVEGDVDEETRAALQQYTERYCVVYQTLAEPSALETEWTFRTDGDGAD